METSPTPLSYMSPWRAFPSGWLAGSAGQLLRQARPSVPPWSCSDFEEDSAFPLLFSFAPQAPLFLYMRPDKLVCHGR